MHHTLSRYAPVALAVLRIVAALLFIEHGTQKLFGLPAFPMPGPLGSLFIIGGVLEVVGGLAVLLGLLTRPVAFVLSGEMAVAYFMAHAPRRPLPGEQRRRCGGPVLLRLPLSGVRRPRRLQPRRRAAAPPDRGLRIQVPAPASLRRGFCRGHPPARSGKTARRR